MSADRYLFKRALRPFSFSVALVVCGTGILAAYRAGYSDGFLASLILIAGLALQAGVNLINDYSDLESVKSDLIAVSRIRRNFLLGNGCFLLAAGIGLYLILSSGPALLWISLIGILGALGYTLEPINYKRRGLAVFLVFWLMGVLMVTGAYYVFAADVTLTVFLLSLPVSLFTSLLLLSNEIRDYESDREDGIRTLTVRIGLRAGTFLYCVSLFAIYLISFGLSIMDVLPMAFWVFLSLPLALFPLKFISKPAQMRTPVTPATGLAFMGFGAVYCSTFLF